MRQNPQVIMFGEMRNRAEMEMALRLAETGHLVFSTLHTRNAYQTITRILDSFE
jgi:twitching motility protein PilT